MSKGYSGLFMPNRRQLLAGIGAGASVLAAPAILRAQTQTLTVPNAGGALEEALRKAFFDEFEAETGVKILTAPYMESARVKAMVEANAVDVDVLNIDPVEAASLSRLGLLEPVDYSIVDRAAVEPWAAKDDYIITDVVGTVMAWSTAAFSNDTRPKTWAEFYDAAAVPGQRGLWKMAMGTLETACLGAGVKPEELYPLNLDAAFETLSKITGDLTWWTSGAQSAQLLISNEIDVGTSWNGRLYGPKKDGAPLDFTFDNTVYTGDAFVVPKGVKDKELAMRFMSLLVKAENQAILARNIPYGPTNPAAFALLEPEVLANLPNAPENSTSGIYQDMEFWAENGDAIFKRFNEWVV